MSLVGMNDRDFIGYRWIKFDEARLKSRGWDLAWDLDNPYKTWERSVTPRLLPAIRLNQHGRPAINKEAVLNPKTIAVYYDPVRSLIHKLIYRGFGDGIYEVRQFRVEHEMSVSHEPSNTYQASTLNGVFRIFSDVTGIRSPLDEGRLKEGGKSAAEPKLTHQSRALIYEGYGTWG
jgi:hypothetical protein